jgi:hypothetical protein
MEVSSHKRVDTVRGYVRSAELSKDQVGARFLCAGREADNEKSYFCIFSYSCWMRSSSSWILQL